jgi:DNA-binding PucR family transcriptional regulator
MSPRGQTKHNAMKILPASDLDTLRRDLQARRASAGEALPPATPQARAALRAAAASLSSIDALTERIRLRLLERWPEFAISSELAGELRAAIDANLRQYFERVVASDSADVLVAPPDALRFAISVQHHGIDTAALIQAYRVGQNIAWSWWTEHLGREIPAHDLLLEAIVRSSQRMFAYVDAVVAQQVQLWEQERERWSGRLTMQRAAAAHRLLEGNAAGQRDALQTLGYSLERLLLAGALWETPAPPLPSASSRSPVSRLELTAERIADVVGHECTLLMPAGENCVWVWFALERPREFDDLARTAAGQLRAGQHLAFGIPGFGLEGFRAGHRQALRARHFAELAQSESGVTRFDEVETLCVMSEDPELLADFVARKLGSLAATGEGMQRLRETVLVWLREGGNASRAAERLRAHKNTVRHRLQRAERLLGRPLEDDRLALELALTMHQRVGSHETQG